MTGTVLTVTPASPLAYGTEYELVLAAAIACNDPRTETLGVEQRLSLITRSYAILDVSAVFNEDRSEIRSLQVATER
ncbi:MAG: hypothetical protein FWH49_08270, partial [Clostridiales bacterium]|nr:hypothetical protein [Clostridiales bacterium]